MPKLRWVLRTIGILLKQIKNIFSIKQAVSGSDVMLLLFQEEDTGKHWTASTVVSIGISAAVQHVSQVCSVFIL